VELTRALHHGVSGEVPTLYLDLSLAGRQRCWRDERYGGTLSFSYPGYGSVRTHACLATGPNDSLTAGRRISAFLVAFATSFDKHGRPGPSILHGGDECAQEKEGEGGQRPRNRPYTLQTSADSCRIAHRPAAPPNHRLCTFIDLHPSS
jgi:hypothetical protein